MALFLVRNMLGVPFCYGLLWIVGEITTVHGDRLRGLRFKTQPEDAIVLPGTTVELKCDACYQNIKSTFGWIVNGSELVLSNVVPRKTFNCNLPQGNGNFRIENISSKAYGVYQCVAKYSGRAIISRKAHVRMPYLYKTSGQPSANITCNETYLCIIKPPNLVSFPEPHFVWEFRRNSNETFTEIEYSHGRSDGFVVSLEGDLFILGVNQSHEGQYRCGITNHAGTVYEVYNVTVGRTNVTNEQNNARPQLSILIKPKNITVAASSPASFECIPSEKNAQIRWLTGTNRNSGRKYNLSLPYRLSVKQTSSSDEGWYTCVASKNSTTVSQRAFLDVRGTVGLNVNWRPRQEITKNGILILTATAYHGQIEWYWNAQLIDRYFLNGSSPNIRNITRNVTKIGDKIVKDEQTLRMEGMSMINSGMYQVLATGFNQQDSEHTEVISYDCGGTLSTAYGSISTPNFPNPYPSNIECLWIIKPYPEPRQNTLYLEIDHFDVGGRPCSDHLQINDGDMSGMSLSFPPQTRPSFTSYLSAFRLFFKSGSCGGGHRGFNATYWITGPTTLPITEPTSLPTEHQTSGHTISTTRTITESTTKESTTNESTTKESTTKESTTNESTTNESTAVVYGVVAFLCVVVLVIALILIIRRKGNFILTCIKGNNTDARKEDTERQGHELNECPSGCEIILYHIPCEKDSSGQSTNQTEDGPLYEVLEGPGNEQPCENLDQSQNVYASVNEGCVSEEDPVPWNFELSFLEEIYTTLTADRDNEDANIYESLRREKAGNERSDGWSVEGMQSSDQDYVSIVSE